MRAVWGVPLLGLLLLVSSVHAQKLDRKTEKDSESSDSPGIIGGKDLDGWKKELDHPDASRRSNAILAIAQFGKAATKCVPLLLKRTADMSDVSPRVKAIHALMVIPIAREDVPKVVAALARRTNKEHENQAAVRIEAARALGQFIPQAGPVVPELIRALANENSSWEIRHLLVSLLWRIGASDKEAAAASGKIHIALLSRLNTDFEQTNQVRLEALIGLGALPRPANPAVLKQVVADLVRISKFRNNKSLAIWAFVGLVAMQDTEPADVALAAIAKFLDGERYEFRVQAIMGLGALGSRAKSKKGQLLALLKDSDPGIVAAACSALPRLTDKQDTATVQALLELTEHKDVQRAGAAVIALVSMKADSPQVMGKLDKLRENKDLNLQLRALIEAGVKELKEPQAKK